MAGRLPSCGAWTRSASRTRSSRSSPMLLVGSSGRIRRSDDLADAHFAAEGRRRIPMLARRRVPSGSLLELGQADETASEERPHAELAGAGHRLSIARFGFLGVRALPGGGDVAE